MPIGEQQPAVTTAHQAVELAQSFGARKGAIADLAAGGPPACFARLRIELAEMRKESITATAMLSMEDGPDDPFFARGKEEIAEIRSSVTSLNAWVQAQQCAPDACECRADRLLRKLLDERGIPIQNGVSRKAGRVTCVFAGEATPGSLVGYAMVDYRNNVDHQVQVHGGWRVRMYSEGGELVPVYQSPGYPDTDVQTYRADTLACVEAVDAALADGHNQPPLPRTPSS